MYERIEKLAEQANAWFPLGYPSAEGGDDTWKDAVIFQTKEDLQKFAEKEIAIIIKRHHQVENILESNQ
jgi:hypothetical protein